MPVPGRHWGIAIAATVLVHAALAALVFWQPAAPGAREAGLRGIEVALGPAGRAPGDAVPATDTTEAQAVDPAEAASTPRPQEVEAPLPEPVVARPLEETVAPEPDTTGIRAVEEEAVVEEEVAAAPTESTVSRIDQPAEPEPDAVPAREPHDVADAASPAEEPVAEAAPAAAGAGGESGSRDASDTGSGDAASSGGAAGVSADYMAELRAWLERHKRYPRRARRRRQEGTALLEFVVDRDGRVLEYRIRESSGHDILDEEVVAMIERARPLPGMPADMRRGRLALVVPVQFRLM